MTQCSRCGTEFTTAQRCSCYLPALPSITPPMLPMTIEIAPQPVTIPTQGMTAEDVARMDVFINSLTDSIAMAAMRGTLVRALATYAECERLRGEVARLTSGYAMVVDELQRITAERDTIVAQGRQEAMAEAKSIIAASQDFSAHQTRAATLREVRERMMELQCTDDDSTSIEISDALDALEGKNG